ncbi:MAG: septum formation protein Maf [Chloroflexi bacterium]|nr:septum formation protein Maf [Chloroflexota bacterium]
MKKSITTVTRLTAPLCLASGSPRRADILMSAGLRFEIDPAEVDESPWLDSAAPDRSAARLAAEKAQAVALRHPQSVVLAADTLVVLDGRIIGKPADADDAREMLRLLRNRRHEVITGVAVVYGENSAAGTETTSVNMRGYTSDEVDAYIRGGSPFDKAGAYGIQDEPFSPASSISGCYLNVVGLPICLASRLLLSTGALAGGYSPACATHDVIGGAA